MKTAALSALLLLAGAPGPAPVQPAQFRFTRAIKLSGGSEHAACAVLDGTTYAHARAALDDLRLFSGGSEIPYALTMSNTSYLSPSGEQAKVLNLGMRQGHIVFDLAMPNRPYSAVELRLRAENFLATAKVTSPAQPGRPGTALGTFTLFDLSQKLLGRDTVLRLAESTFAFLHVDLRVSAVGSQAAAAFKLSPDMVAGASVPPSREAQTLYTQVARSTALTQNGTRTEATFLVPAQVPVERVRFELAPSDRTNFSRTVLITAHPVGAPQSEREEIAGQIARVRLEEDGSHLRRNDLSLAATLGANARQPAEVVVSVENGDDRPLAIESIDLEMRQRKLCFAVTAEPLAMFYGDPAVGAPRYDFSRIFAPSEQTRVATLGPEVANPEFITPPDRRNFVDRHPELVWVALLAVFALLALVALSSAKKAA